MDDQDDVWGKTVGGFRRVSPPPEDGMIRVFWVPRVMDEEAPTAAELNAGLELLLKQAD